MKFGDTEKAIDALERYTLLAIGNIYPSHLHGDNFFDLVDDWLEKTLALGDVLPRDSKIIRENISKSIENNKAFFPLQNDPRFQNMIHKLKTLTIN